ncbi:MAG TPA: flagellin [Vicinamibacterales bacterium]|nr:flagellin [Vicinamibacterales bacterium]
MASFSVVTNIASVNAQANLYQTSQGLNTTLQQLSSGLRINYAGNDAAGLGVANGYRSDLATLNQGILNANDGLSSLQIKDGALSNVSQLLDRLSTLATQAASGSTTDSSRTILNNEFQDVLTEINRETSVASLNTSTGFSVFVSNNGTNGKIGGTIAAVTTSTLGISTLAITNQAAATTAVSTIRAAVNTLATSQGKVGDLENRLNYAITLAQSQVVNDTAAESRIMDANMAQASASMTKYNILNQSGISALAQANSSSAAILTLLR